jgi:hypothetical protein
MVGAAAACSSSGRVDEEQRDVFPEEAVVEQFLRCVFSGGEGGETSSDGE